MTRWRPRTTTRGLIRSLTASIRFGSPASFLTILPLGPAKTLASPDDQAASFGWFPLIGFLHSALLFASKIAFS